MNQRTGTLGTFAGVFTPSILTILGIILFLRLGFVVGNAGLTRSLIIIGIATTVSVLTSTSLAAIATNIDVKGGGDYYLISRTLGVEFGGAIGVVLFLAQSVSIAFYCIGFGEVTATILSIESELGVQIIALAAVLLLFGFAWAGADVATRFQFVVMAVLAVALASFFLGALDAPRAETLGAGWSPPPEALGFWAVFAIFFPAVTGFTQGVSMSGDLADPARSLPRGTFAAVALSTVVYVAVAVIIAASVPGVELVEDRGEAMRSIAVVGPFVVLGVIAATLSSAMASFLGAPRILQSLAADRVYPGLHFFAKGHGPQANPRRAVLLSLAIAVATLGLGALNAIAAVVSMFFLISYGMLNYATYWEARASSPSFRPTFRFFDKRLSLAGAAACLGAMLAINPLAGGGALLVLFSLYRLLGWLRRRRPSRWADASPAHQFQRAKESIRALSREEHHARNWRPLVLAFSADPHRRERLLRFATWLEGGSGFTAAIHLLEGGGLVMRGEREAEEAALHHQVEELGLDVYPRVILSPDGLSALPVVVQSFGLGGIEANTAIFGWPEDRERAQKSGYRERLRDVARLGVNIVAVSSDEGRWHTLTETPKKRRRIDVWWSDDDSGRFALLTAYLFTRTDDWSRATIRVLAAAAPGEAGEVEADLTELLLEARIRAEVVCLPAVDRGAIAAAAADATMFLATMRLRDDGALGPGDIDLYDLLPVLPMTAVVIAAEEFDLLAGPESGRLLTLVEAEEARDTARARLSEMEKQYAEADRQVEAMHRRVVSDPALAAEFAELERLAEDMRRRVLKARARLHSAEAEVRSVLESQ